MEKNIIKGTTTRGFKFAIDKRIIKDYRFVEILSKTNSDDENEQLINITKMVDLLFNNDTKKKEEFLTFLSDEDGFVDAETVLSEVAEVMQKLGNDAKK